jgi:hypothetical protein
MASKRKPTMTMGSKMAVATAQCKKMGHKGFKAGSAGEACRERMAAGIEKTHKIVKGKAKTPKRKRRG